MWFVRQGDSHFITCRIRVNRYGWPFTTVETYKRRWNARNLNSPQQLSISEELKAEFRAGMQEEVNRARALPGVGHTYPPLNDRYPDESGHYVYWIAFILNFVCAAVMTVLVVATIHHVKSALIHFLVSKRSRRGLCGRCKYDMRGSIESGRCPECGTIWDSRLKTKSMDSIRSKA